VLISLAFGQTAAGPGLLTAAASQLIQLFRHGFSDVEVAEFAAVGRLLIFATSCRCAWSLWQWATRSGS
jgi:hypothetical protein